MNHDTTSHQPFTRRTGDIILYPSEAVGVRQSLHQLEQAFVEETLADRQRAERLQRQIELRGRKRELDKVHKKGSFRFVVLCLVLVLTAVLVTIAMFETLYYVMG